jgi:hypothetical protein
VEPLINRCPKFASELAARRPLEDVVHYDRYDMSKYMSNEQTIEFLRELRGLTRRGYHDEPKKPGG